MRWTVHVARVGTMRSPCNILVAKQNQEWRDHLENLGVDRYASLRRTTIFIRHRILL
jgi:hypothetical protein